MGTGALSLWSIFRRCDLPLPKKPLTQAQFEAKFRDCARNAVQPLPEAEIDAALQTIARLELMPDARELLSRFAG